VTWDDDDRRVYRISRNRLQHGVLLAVVLGAIGVASLFFAGPALPDGQLLGAVNLALAAGVLAYVGYTARDTRPRMILDREGLWYRDWGIGPLPWHQIGETRIAGIRLNAHLSIELRDPDALLAGLDDATRRRFKRNRLVRLPRLMVPNDALDAPLEEILAAIRARLDRTKD